MKPFLEKNFLLHSETAQHLYHDHAAKMPIIDYHSHLSPKDIAEDKQFLNLSQVWLAGDHYKWRAMRTNGVSENFCTGNADDFEKFSKWAETVPYTLRNPLYHWTHLELQRYFGITRLLNSSSAKSVYDEASSKLRTKEYSVRNLLKMMNVEVVCTTDDPIDSLEYHKKIKDDKFSIKVLPTWRPDKAMAVEDTMEYNKYINKLGEVANIEIRKFADLKEALRKRQEFFHSMGCRISDHGLDTIIAEEYKENEISLLFASIRNHDHMTLSDIMKFKSAMLYEFAIMDHEKGWTQQFHIGAMRNNNSLLYKTVGPDIGFDSIGDVSIAKPMSFFLDKLNKEGKLTRTILYNLNPSDNEVYATMLGNFQDGSIPGKMQWGSGWWFLDQKEGMINHLNTLSSLGLLSRFVGMLTDSRSFLSYPRHEYFRRILCNLIGTDIENGELPSDPELTGKLIQNISYYNAKSYFGF